MARTLPWLNNAATSTAQPSKPRPTKRQRTLDPASEPENSTAPRAIAAKKKQASSRADRTPTTSPPPAPPPTSPLRPGLNADDIYIIVEDEFLSTARLFTAHLHHAEYVRLKNEAKKRNIDGIERIERPVDSITEMRAETRKKKEAERQEVRAKAAVNKAAPAARRGKGEGSGSSDSDFEEGERNDDPWQGTQLQHFMTTSPRKTLAGLTGLQGVVSYTRAAAGFARAEKRTSLNAQTTPTKRGGRTDRNDEVVDDETDEDTDDLDAPTYKKTTSRGTAPEEKTSSLPKHKARKHPPKTKVPSPSRPPPHRAFLDVTLIPPTPPSSRPPIKGKPQPQPSPEPPITHEPRDETQAARERLEARRKAKARRERMEKAKKESTGVAVDEIPVFLV